MAALFYFICFVYMPLTEAQAYFNRAGDVTAIEVYVDHPDQVDHYRQLVTEAAGRPIFIVDWRQRNATFFSALQVERNVMFVILTLIVLVTNGVSLGAIATMAPTLRSRFGQPSSRLPMPLVSASFTVEWQSAQVMPIRDGRKPPLS